eukprot:1121991_1
MKIHGIECEIRLNEMPMNQYNLKTGKISHIRRMVKSGHVKREYNIRTSVDIPVMDPHAFHEKKPKYEWARAIESHAVKDVNSSNENEQDDEKMLLEQKSNMHGSTKQFYNFLKQHRLDQFFDKFKENECADIRDIEYLMEDQEFLKNDIGIKSPIHRRRFIGECTKLKEEMD